MLVVFLLPAIINFAHATSGHNHYDDTCIQSDTHLHESKINCDLVDIHLVNVGDHVFAKAYTLFVPIFPKVKFSFSEFSYTKVALNPSNRGPPFC